MDTNLMSIAYASSALSQTQTLSAIQTQLLRNAMDIETQNAQELLQLMAGSTATASHPFLGNKLDVFV